MRKGEKWKLLKTGVTVSIVPVNSLQNKKCQSSCKNGKEIKWVTLPIQVKKLSTLPDFIRSQNWGLLIKLTLWGKSSIQNKKLGNKNLKMSLLPNMLLL